MWIRLGDPFRDIGKGFSDDTVVTSLFVIRPVVDAYEDSSPYA
jgi:hypothetical protein